MSADQLSPCPRLLCDGTWREWFDIGMDEHGKFSIDYRGHCRDCDLEHTFQHEERVTLGEVHFTRELKS